MKYELYETYFLKPNGKEIKIFSVVASSEQDAIEQINKIDEKKYWQMLFPDYKVKAKLSKN